jgi:hypothetical protein
MNPKKPIGALFEISIDGVPRSYRDLRESAIEGGRFLKRKYPNSEVAVRDLRTNERVIIKDIPAIAVADLPSTPRSRRH